MTTDPARAVPTATRPVSGRPLARLAARGIPVAPTSPPGAASEDPIRTALEGPELWIGPSGGALELSRVAGRLSRELGLPVEILWVRAPGGPIALDWRPADGDGVLAALVDAVEHGRLDLDEALRVLDPHIATVADRPSLDPVALAAARDQGRLIGRGRSLRGRSVRGRLAVDPGVVEGELAVPVAERRPWILVASNLGVEHVGAIGAAAGIILLESASDGAAAILAAELGTPCPVGAGGFSDAADGLETAAGARVDPGQWLSIDGRSGGILAGRLALAGASGPASPLDRLLVAADGRRRLAVRVDADGLDDARRGFRLGADGIGLCRLEHLLLSPTVLTDLRAALRLAMAGFEPDPESCRRLESFVADEVAWLLRAAAGRPVRVRLLDLPLHEILDGPSDPTPESNPMLGLRGVRLAVRCPSLYRVQIRALDRALATVRAEGRPAALEVLVPMIATVAEFEWIADRVAEWADRTLPIGPMIETPRAALLAGPLARRSDFLSFGTNDLTQMVFGVSRDDTDRFLDPALALGLFEHDPFRTLDTEGVGRLMAMAVAAARAERPGIPICVCGTHAGDPASIRFIEALGIDEVSCRAEQVPIARLAAAQARV